MTLGATDIDDQLVEQDEVSQEIEGEESTVEGEEGESQPQTEESDEVVVSIGDPPTEVVENPEQESEGFRALRQAVRDKDKQLRDLRRQLESATAKAGPAEIEVGARPTMESCGFDEEKFAAEMESWHGRKAAVEAKKREREDAETKRLEAWQKTLDTYTTAKAGLKVKDFDEAESAARDALSVTQQGIILNGAERPELVVYALGKSAAKLKELAAITDPVKFAFAIAKVEMQLKVTPKKVAPPPERVIKGSATTVSADKRLEQLRAEAEKTGDMTKVLAYKRQLGRS